MLDPALREFIASKFSAIEQVEVFMLLYRTPDREWSPDEVAAVLEMAPQSAGMRLFLLASAALVSAVGSSDVRYRYARTPGLDQLASFINDAWENDRAGIMEVFGGATPARDFADAFRLRKP
jgi:hypothetical protein